jgi:hypothetical protein
MWLVCFAVLIIMYLLGSEMETCILIPLVENMKALKIVFYYPSNELKSCVVALYLIGSEIQQSFVSSSEHKQFRGFLVRIDLADFLLETFA